MLAGSLAVCKINPPEPRRVVQSPLCTAQEAQKRLLAGATLIILSLGVRRSLMNSSYQYREL